MCRQPGLSKFPWWLSPWALLASLVMVGCTPTASALANPCLSPPDPNQDLRLLAEATQQLQKYLEAQGMKAVTQVREEGALMLGAYPRPQAFWTISITEPPLTKDDPRLDDVALAAHCLRSGGVWLTITTPAGQTQLISYPPADLKARSKSEEFK